MEIKDGRIDGGRAFDWGKTSEDYAKYRDIYPPELYEKILARGLCVKGQRVLDLGTGTGVLPRNLYRYGARWVGEDISEEQIGQARALAQQAGMDITFVAAPAEELDYPAGSFDVVTACQCFWYFDHQRLAPRLANMLKANGRLLILYMAWLPGEDAVAGQSEKLVLRYNPAWSGRGEYRHPIVIPACVQGYFEPVSHEEFDVKLPFTRESWNGRMKTCRGVEASLPPDRVAQWERDHLAMLERIAPERFEVLHYCALAELKVRK